MIGHLEVALVLVDDVFLPRVVELDEGQVALRLLADGLVDGLVVELETKVHPKVCNHGEDPLLGPSSG